MRKQKTGKRTENKEEEEEEEEEKREPGENRKKNKQFQEKSGWNERQREREREREDDSPVRTPALFSFSSRDRPRPRPRRRPRRRRRPDLLLLRNVLWRTQENFPTEQHQHRSQEHAGCYDTRTRAHPGRCIAISLSSRTFFFFTLVLVVRLPR